MEAKKRRFDVMPFSESIEEVKQFINQRAKVFGINDDPNDMQGGLKLSLLQDWTEEAVKRVVIISEMPPHGKKYHTVEHKSYFNENGSPDGIQIEDLMQEFQKKDIDVVVYKMHQHLSGAIGVMQANHPVVRVVDFTDVKEEVRRVRLAQVEELASVSTPEQLEMARQFAGADPTEEDIKAESQKMFIENMTKGIAQRVSDKKNA